ncbi:hypothetical protein ACQW5G_03745 [Fructilactobacillus sp. Tb1]|uniref:hypothetical protein n=1 Tax=Fructilactobacillus sp. Tb1 TaxID=3422304 RepID=UPI003D26C22A
MNKRVVQVIKNGKQMALPVTDAIKINLNDQFYVSQTNDGEIVFTPVQKDIFSNPRFANLDFSQSEIDFGKFMGEEKLDD